MSDPQSQGSQPNETLRLLMARASCRSFSGRKIPPEVLRQVLSAGTQAPSGGNLQPYSIIKIENDETLQKLVGLCGGQKVIGRAPLALLFSIDWNLVERWARLQDAPCACAASFRHFWISFQDTAICAQSVCTAADAVELGSVYIGSVLNSFHELRDMFQLPDKVFPVVLLLLGYPRARPPRQRRLPLELVVHDERYRDPSDEELQAAFAEKYPWKKALSEKELDQLSVVCKNVHGRQFAEECVAAARRDGFINPAQWYFALWYRSDTLAQGNERFVRTMREFGFDWFNDFPFQDESPEG